MAALLTYPAGAIAAVASYLPVYFDALTPTEAVALAAPLYVGAGYVQWYVLVPRYFAFRRQRGKR